MSTMIREFTGISYHLNSVRVEFGTGMFWTYTKLIWGGRLHEPPFFLMGDGHEE